MYLPSCKLSKKDAQDMLGTSREEKKNNPLDTVFFLGGLLPMKPYNWQTSKNFHQHSANTGCCQQKELLIGSDAERK